MKKLLAALVAFYPLLLIAQTINIIPQPVSVKKGNGSFIIDQNTYLSVSPEQKDLQPVADFLINSIKEISDVRLSLNNTKEKRIALKIAKTDGIGEEGYLLHVTPKNITLTANTKAGILYGIQSLFQTLPAVHSNAVLQVPVMQVKDYPRFRWRGMHLDVSRHFFPISFVKQYIDLMARYKLNYFHWHLTDDQGWRIEIKKYPKLTSVAAFRNGTIVGHYPGTSNDNTRYGGYYTQEEVKEVVAYATQRNITVVPEIEMPGHSSAAIAAYPWLSCFPEKQTKIPAHPSEESKRVDGKKVQETWGVFEDIYCAGNDSTFLFMQDVMSEVLNLFPSKYIHVGGDEAPKDHWKKCSKCQARMSKEGLKDEHELQSYFIQRMEKYLNNKGRTIIGWDEILEGGLAPNAIVMSWRGEAGGIEAAKLNHDVIMTPGTPVYFDHYQGDPASEPLAFGGFNTLKRVYDYEPVPKELNTEQAKYIMGAQANLWTEYIPTSEQATYMVLPRMLALAEVVWSSKESRDWSRFNDRLQIHFKAFDQKGLRYSKGNFKVDIKPLIKDRQLFVNLSTEAYKGEIHYTTDGTTPTIQSAIFKAPIRIDSSIIVKAVAGVDGKIMSVIPSQQSFVTHKALGKNVNYTYPVSRYYMADGPNSLTDGIKGTKAVGKYWHGIAGKDLIATIDLGEEKDINQVTLGCLQHYNDWVFMPQWVKVELSTDGMNFTESRTVNNTVSVHEITTTIKDFTAAFSGLKAKFVRVTAKVLDACPAGHPGEGKPAWVFADEIIVQ